MHTQLLLLLLFYNDLSISQISLTLDAVMR